MEQAARQVSEQKRNQNRYIQLTKKAFAVTKKLLKHRENLILWNKGAFISKKSGELGVQVKRSQMIDYLKKRDINSFLLAVPKGDEKRAIKYFSDYGFNVIAKSGYNENATAKFQDVHYVLSKKEMYYLDLDLKIKKYYKRGWKG